MKSNLKSSPLIKRVEIESYFSKDIIMKYQQSIGKFQKKFTPFRGNIFDKIIFLNKYRRFKKGGLKKLKKGYKYLDVSSDSYKMLDLNIPIRVELDKVNALGVKPAFKNSYALIKKKKKPLKDSQIHLLDEPNREPSFEFISSEYSSVPLLSNRVDLEEDFIPKKRSFIPSFSTLQKTAFLNKKRENFSFLFEPNLKNSYKEKRDNSKAYALIVKRKERASLNQQNSSSQEPNREFNFEFISSEPSILKPSSKKTPNLSTLSLQKKDFIENRVSRNFGFKRLKENSSLLFEPSLKNSYKEKRDNSKAYALIAKRKERASLNQQNSSSQEPNREFNFEFISSEPSIIKPSSKKTPNLSTLSLQKKDFIENRVSRAFGFKRLKENRSLLFEPSLKNSYKEKIDNSKAYALIAKRKERASLNQKNSSQKEPNREFNFEFISSEPSIIKPSSKKTPNLSTLSLQKKDSIENRVSRNFGFKRLKENRSLLFEPSLKNSYKEKIDNSKAYALIAKRKERASLNQKNSSQKEPNREFNFEFISSEPSLKSLSKKTPNLSTLSLQKKDFIENRVSRNFGFKRLKENSSLLFEPSLKNSYKEKIDNSKAYALIAKRKERASLNQKNSSSQEPNREFNFEFISSEPSIIKPSSKKTPNLSTLSLQKKDSIENRVSRNFGFKRLKENRSLLLDANLKSNSYNEQRENSLKALISSELLSKPNSSSQKKRAVIPFVTNFRRTPSDKINSSLLLPNLAQSDDLQRGNSFSEYALKEPLYQETSKKRKLLGGYRDFLMHREYLQFSLPRTQSNNQTLSEEEIKRDVDSSHFYMDFVTKANKLNQRIDILEKRNRLSSRGLDERSVISSTNLNMNLSYPKRVDESPQEVKYARADRHEQEEGADDSFSQSEKREGTADSKSASSSSEELNELSMKLFQRLKHDIALEYIRAGK